MFETAYAYFYKHMLKMKHPAELSWVLVYPVIGILSIGIFALFLFNPTSQAVNPFFFVIAGVLIWEVYGLIQRAIAYGVIFDIWDGSIRHTYLYRHKFLSYLAGTLSFGAINVVAAVMIVAAVAYFVFNFNILAGGIYLLASMLATSIFATATGLFIISMVLRKGYNYISLVWIITGIIMVFSGVYYPVDVFPEPAKTVGELIPATHAISALRGSLGLQGVDINSELSYAFLSSALLLGISVWFYFRSLKFARMKGTLNER